MKVRLPHLPQLTSQLAGFTMIELLIVITILGILAVAVLSAINPIEQINRGRDTGYQSDAEQLINAIERYNAFQGHSPWKKDDASLNNITTLLTINASWNDDTTGTPCKVLGKLSVLPTTSSCTGTNELKQTFVTRIEGLARPLYVYSRGQQGDSTYVCFLPQSQAFLEQAKKRCTTGLPADLSPISTALCVSGKEYICLS